MSIYIRRCDADFLTDFFIVDRDGLKSLVFYDIIPLAECVHDKLDTRNNSIMVSTIMRLIIMKPCGLRFDHEQFSFFCNAPKLPPLQNK